MKFEEEVQGQPWAFAFHFARYNDLLVPGSSHQLLWACTKACIPFWCSTRPFLLLVIWGKLQVQVFLLYLYIKTTLTSFLLWHSRFRASILKEIWFEYGIWSKMIQVLKSSVSRHLKERGFIQYMSTRSPAFNSLAKSFECFYLPFLLPR